MQRLLWKSASYASDQDTEMMPKLTDECESQPWDIRETLAEAHRRHDEPQD